MQGGRTSSLSRQSYRFYDGFRQTLVACDNPHLKIFLPFRLFLCRFDIITVLRYAG